MDYKKLTKHFEYWHKNPPAPFNPDFDPKADKRREMVRESMERDNYYKTHTREECKAEWHKRYDDLKKNGF